MKMLYFSKSYIQKKFSIITNLANLTELEEEKQTFRIFDRI